MGESNEDPFLQHFERLIDENVIQNLSSKTTEDFSSVTLGPFQFSSSSETEKPNLERRDFAMKKSLLKNLDESGRELTPVQKEFLALISRYHDVYFPNRTNANDLGEELRFVVCLHLLNHV